MKKAVAGLLAAVMLLSSALAVDTVSFSDEDQITYRDAVLSLCQVGIINGKDDGTFDPKGSVTRAEAAKMIATYVNGAPIVWSSDPAFIGTPGYPEAPTFNDIGVLSTVLLLDLSTGWETGVSIRREKLPIASLQR